ncbi:MAG: SAM-dependent methyltransferase [Ruminococcaceae bacterium]|nr:SAM-dependent methyltransferase [Oscillospiraceae bacterium]
MVYTNPPILDSRLSLAASFVRQGAVCADIGTDHAYIPIYLLMTGRSDFAIAADINEGPLERAKENAARYGIEANIEFCLADGLSGLPLHERQVSDIVICGMGGELIASILSASEYVKNSGIRLILQPMSATAKLRAYLSENGFAEINGGFARAQDKLYQCIVCHYDGKVRRLSPASLELGEKNIKEHLSDPVFSQMLEKLINKCSRAIEGMKQGSVDTNEMESLLSELLEIKKRKV